MTNAPYEYYMRSLLEIIFNGISFYNYFNFC